MNSSWLGQERQQPPQRPRAAERGGAAAMAPTAIAKIRKLSGPGSRRAAGAAETANSPLRARAQQLQLQGHKAVIKSSTAAPAETKRRGINKCSGPGCWKAAGATE